MTKPTTEAPAPKRRRSTQERINELEMRLEREKLIEAAREAHGNIKAEMRAKKWADARQSVALLDRALVELEKANGHG